MKNTIKCKNCGTEIEVSEALTHQIEEQVLLSLNTQHQKELKETQKQAEETAEKKIAQVFESQLKSLQKENEEEKIHSKKLTSQIDELLSEMRKLRRKDEEREIEMKKKFIEEEEKVRGEAIKQAEEAHRIKDLEKDKKLLDTLKQVDELKARMQQGSQQLQGEVLELELEKILKQEFSSDSISEVKKGDRGADNVQEVIDRLGRKCGVILWESKNAQWQNNWISKLKEDQRNKKADIAVLVTIVKPEWLKSFTYKDGIWITTWESVVPLAFALRFMLVSMHHERAANEGKKEKTEVLYEYLRGIEFKHRVSAIAEGFTNLQAELEREKRWFATKWNRQEKEIRKVLDNTYGMYGDLQGIMGSNSLPDIKVLSLPDGETYES